MEMVSVKMTKDQMFALKLLFEQKFIDLTTNEASVQTLYKVMKLVKLLDDECSVIKELITKIQKRLANYEYERKQICIKYADKTEDGKPVIENGQYVITEKKSEFDKEIASLQTKYKDDLEKVAKDKEELNSILQEEVELELPTFSLDEISNIKLTVKELMLLEPILK